MSTVDEEQILNALDEVDRASVLLRSKCLRLIDLLRANDARICAHDGSVVGIIGPRPTDDPPSRPA